VRVAVDGRTALWQDHVRDELAACLSVLGVRLSCLDRWLSPSAREALPSWPHSAKGYYVMRVTSMLLSACFSRPLELGATGCSARSPSTCTRISRSTLRPGEQ